jgi:hypothetical protein
MIEDEDLSVAEWSELVSLHFSQDFFYPGNISRATFETRVYRRPRAFAASMGGESDWASPQVTLPAIAWLCQR